MKKLKRTILMVMAAVIALPAMAQWNDEQAAGTAVPASGFQSTSTLRGSGSAYSAQPTLNDNGSAVYTGAAAPSYAPGIRKVADPLNTDEEVEDAGGGLDGPIGDAALPLALIACAYAIYRFVRGRREAAE